MELLAKLLGGADRVKIMRFFLHNENDNFSLSTIYEKTKVKSSVCRSILNALISIGFLEKKRQRVTILEKTKKDTKIKENISYKLNNNLELNGKKSKKVKNYIYIDGSDRAIIQRGLDWLDSMGYRCDLVLKREFRKNYHSFPS